MKTTIQNCYTDATFSVDDTSDISRKRRRESHKEKERGEEREREKKRGGKRNREEVGELEKIIITKKGHKKNVQRVRT